MATYRVELTSSAEKQFARLPAKVQSRVTEAIFLLSQNPYSELLKTKKIKGAEELYRVRTGDYRIVYTVRNDVLTIVVIKMGHRREVYR